MLSAASLALATFLASSVATQDSPEYDLDLLVDLLRARDDQIATARWSFEVWEWADSRPRHLRRKGVVYTQGHQKRRMDLEYVLKDRTLEMVWDGVKFATYHKDHNKPRNSWVEVATFPSGRFLDPAYPFGFGSTVYHQPLPLLLSWEGCLVLGREAVGDDDCVVVKVHSPEQGPSQERAPYAQLWIDDQRSLLVKRAEVYRKIGPGEEPGASAFMVGSDAHELASRHTLLEEMTLDGVQLPMRWESSFSDSRMLAGFGYETILIESECELSPTLDENTFSIVPESGTHVSNEVTGRTHLYGASSHEGLSPFSLERLLSHLESSGLELPPDASSYSQLPGIATEEYIDSSCADLALYLFLCINGSCPTSLTLTREDDAPYVHDCSVGKLQHLATEHDISTVAVEAEWDELFGLQGVAVALIRGAGGEDDVHYALVTSLGDELVVAFGAGAVQVFERGRERPFPSPITIIARESDLPPPRPEETSEVQTRRTTYFVLGGAALVVAALLTLRRMRQ